MSPITTLPLFAAEPGIAEIEEPIQPGTPQPVATLVLREDLRWVPALVYLASLRRRDLRVRAPFAVAIRTEGQSVIADASEVEELGYGSNVSAALLDLQATLVELFETLEREEPRLGPDLRETWSVLQQKVERRRRANQG